MTSPTYNIIGGDGQEYGPVSLEGLLDWVRDGRVVGGTQVRRSDASSWVPAAQVPELALELAKRPQLPTGDAGVLEPVGFWVRVAAYLIDTLLLNVAAGLFVRKNPDDWQNMAWVWSAGLFVGAAYFVLMTGRYGATVGKLVVGARIVREDGSPIGYKIALFRYLAAFLSWLICMIGYLMVAFREDKRALHDLLAGTRVVHRR